MLQCILNFNIAPLKCQASSVLTNGRVLYIALDNGDIAVYLCNSGYMVKGNVISTCAYGSQPPVCVQRAE